MPWVIMQMNSLDLKIIIMELDYLISPESLFIVLSVFWKYKSISFAIYLQEETVYKILFQWNFLAYFMFLCFSRPVYSVQLVDNNWFHFLTMPVIRCNPRKEVRITYFGQELRDFQCILKWFCLDYLEIKGFTFLFWSVLLLLKGILYHSKFMPDFVVWK